MLLPLGTTSLHEVSTDILAAERFSVPCFAAPGDQPLSGRPICWIAHYVTDNQRSFTSQFHPVNY